MTQSEIPADVIECGRRALAECDANPNKTLFDIVPDVLRAAGWPELVAERDRLSVLNEKLINDFNSLSVRESFVRDERDRLRKWLEERPTKPHPVDQLNNLSKTMWSDAEKEVTVQAALIAELAAGLQEARVFAEIEQKRLGHTYDDGSDPEWTIVLNEPRVLIARINTLLAKAEGEK